MTAALQTFDEIRLLAGRSPRHIPRIPEKAFGAVILPVVFVVLFSYVFGSAITIPGGGDYHAYLVSGIFAQSMMGTVPGPPSASPRTSAAASWTVCARCRSHAAR